MINIKRRPLIFLPCLLRNVLGAIIVEFALILPLIILLIYGMVELSQLIQANNKISQTAAYLGDNITKYAQTAADISNLYNAAYDTLLPFDVQRGSIIVTCFAKTATGMPIYWQINRNGTAIPGQASKVGTVGNNADPALFNQLPLKVGDSMIVVEVYYKYDPYLGGDFSPVTSTILYNRIFFRPRSSNLIYFTVS